MTKNIANVRRREKRLDEKSSDKRRSKSDSTSNDNDG